MSTKKGTKINQLLQNQPSGVVFLTSWLGEQADHSWLKYASTEKVNLESGKRALAEESEVYNAKYKITIPKELGAQ